jgi:hypothetical protein
MHPLVHASVQSSFHNTRNQQRAHRLKQRDGLVQSIRGLGTRAGTSLSALGLSGANVRL